MTSEIERLIRAVPHRGNVTNRLINALHAENITTIDQLANAHINYLIGVGPAGIKMIKEVLHLWRTGTQEPWFEFCH